MEQQWIDTVRSRMLALHKSLVDEERGQYEKSHGRQSSGEFLQALIRDEGFAWLRPLTTLIVEFEEHSEAPDSPRGKAWIEQLRTLLDPNPAGNAFQRRYAELLHQSPQIAHAHGATLHALARPG